MTRTVHVIVREDGPSWSAWSPQCPGLAISKPTRTGMLRSLPGTIAWYFEDDPLAHDDALDIRVHIERTVGGVVIRVAHDDHRAARQEVANRVIAALGNPDFAERLRAAPRNWADEVACICALPTDTRAWLASQLYDEGDGAVVAVPVSGTFLWARPFEGGHTGAPPDADDSARRMTFEEVTQTPDREQLLVCA